jgi:hypothetical protein
MRKYLFTLLLTLISLSTWAQDVPVVTDLVATPNYWVTIFVGVLLALIFQLLLTALSVAIGVTAIGNVKEIYVESKYGNDDDDDDDDDNSNTNTGVVVTTAFGAWSTITTAISLFLATMIALDLTLIKGEDISMILGLAIWAAFFVILLYLEGRMLSTVVGGLVNTAVSGLRASGDAVKSVFASSPQSQIQSVADNTIEKLRQEFGATFDNNSISDAIDTFMDKLDKRVPTYDKLKGDIEKIVSDNTSSSSPATWTAIQGVINTAIDQSESSGDTEKTEQLKQLAKDAKAAYDKGGSREEQAKNIATSVTNMDREQVDKYVKQIKSALQSGSGEGMDSQQMQQQLNAIIKNPRGAGKLLQKQLGEMDRDTIVELVNKNTSLEKSQIETYVDKAEQTIKSITESLGITNNDSDSPNMLQQVEQSIAGFVNGTGRSELNYEALKGDFQRAMNNPNDSLDIIKSRLSKFDRETLMALLTNNSRINRSDIDNIVNQVDSTRTEMLQEIDKLEDKARATMKNVERKAVIQAEHTRKTAISAAWWLVATIILSGAAAAAGSLIAL